MATLTKEYKRLIERFPLRPIKDDEQKKQAVAVMKELALKGSSRNDDETDYLVVLGRLIADYEHVQPALQKFLAGARSATPAEALTFLLESNGLTQNQLSHELGIDQGNLSAFLAGRRKLSTAVALKLANHFAVSVELFLRT